MNGATYHVTTPAQLERHRDEQRRAEERLARSIERTARLTRSLCGKQPAPGMRRALSALALSALVACGGGGGGGGAPVMLPAAPPAPAADPAPAPAPKDCSVVLYGDSIMWGEDVNRTRLASPPAATLKRIRPAYTIEDRSIGGESATTRSKTFNNEHRPQRIVVIQHGINDVFQGDDFEVPLKAMITYAQAEGHKVVLTGLSRMDFDAWLPYAERVKRIAIDTGAMYGEWSSVPGKTYDTVHPDQEMSIALVERLAWALDRVAPECAQ